MSHVFSHCLQFDLANSIDTIDYSDYWPPYKCENHAIATIWKHSDIYEACIPYKAPIHARHGISFVSAIIGQ